MNIFITKRGHAKILDFGLAKVISGLSDAETCGEPGQSTVTLKEQLTSPGAALGTVGYMSPEQVRGKDLDARTDLFSFGVVLYEMATGKLPFRGDTSGAIFDSILNRVPTPPLRLNPELPLKLEEVINKALEKDREVRYQFAAELKADLKRLRRETESGHIAIAPDRLPPGRSWRRALWAGTCILLLAVIAWTLRGRFVPQPDSLEQVEMTQLTRSGRVKTAAISPDGKYVAYAQAEAVGMGVFSKESLWVKQVAGGEVQVIAPSAVSYDGLTFSPDGDNLYLVRSEASNPDVGTLYRIPILGGTQRRLAVDVDCPVTFSPDGKQMAFVRDSFKKRNSVVIVTNQDGSEERQVAERDKPEEFLSVEWSPTGTTIAALVTEYDASTTSYIKLVELPVPSGPERSVSSERWSGTWGLAWISNGEALLVSAQYQAGGPTHIVHVSRESGQMRKITSGLNTSYEELTVSADSRIMAALQRDFSSDLWVGRLSDPNSFHPITTGGRSAWGAWTPDGKIVYANYAVGNSIWMAKADGSGAIQLTPTTEYDVSYPRVSPNGRYIVFTSWKTGSPHFWRVDADGSNPRQLTNNGADNTWSSYSPDGKWVIYAKQGSDNGVWKVPIEGGDPVRVQEGEAFTPVVSPDGRMIAYRDASGDPSYKLAVIPFAGGPAIKKLAVPKSPAWHWSIDNRAIMYIDNESGVSNIWSQSIEGGKPTQITHFNNDQIADFELSQDGLQVVVGRLQVNADVVLIRGLR
jgi:Tol biopolymer transport system component